MLFFMQALGYVSKQYLFSVEISKDLARPDPLNNIE